MVSHKSSRDVVVARLFPKSRLPIGNRQLHKHVHDFPLTRFVVLGRSSRETRIDGKTRRKLITSWTCHSICIWMTCTFSQALPTMRKPQRFESDPAVVSTHLTFLSLFVSKRWRVVWLHIFVSSVDAPLYARCGVEIPPPC